MVADGSGRAVTLARTPCTQSKSALWLFRPSGLPPQRIPPKTLTWRKDGCPSFQLPWSLPFPENRIRPFPSVSPIRCLRWPISRPTSTSGIFYPTVVTAAASPDADCNCLLKVQMPAFGLRTPSVRGRGICGKHADDLPFPRAADIQLLENCPVLGHDDKALNLQSRKSM